MKKANKKRKSIKKLSTAEKSSKSNFFIIIFAVFVLWQYLYIFIVIRM